VNYLRIIHRILAPGGVWINLGMESMSSMSRASVDSEPQLGPLLWHFEENTTSDPSIELDLEEVKTLAAHIGFEIKVGILYPSLVSHALHLLFVRTNAQ
jgi:carnosine N-methyltransferase